LAQGLGGFLPILIGADGLLRRLGRQLEIEVVEAVVAEQRQGEAEQRLELLPHLLACREDVRVVLGHAAYPRQPVDHARLLVAVHRAELEQPHRELAVGPRARAVDQDVIRTVHRLEVVLRAAVELHRREHPVRVPVEVTADVEQLPLGDMRRRHEQVVVLDVALSRVVLHQHADQTATRMEDREPRPDLVGEGEQVELRAELAVVAPLGLLDPLDVGVETRLVGPRGAVDPRQLRVLLVAAPVRAAHGGQRERAQPSGRGHVRT